MKGKSERQSVIRSLVRRENIANQEELQSLLEKEGFIVAQATLSRDLKELLSRIVSQAEEFIAGLHTWKNGEITLSDLRARYRDWYRDVHRKYIELTDIPVPPEELSEWCDAVLDLAGWVLDLAIPLDEKAEYDEKGTSWLLTHAAEKYYESLERLRVLERNL